MIRGIERHNREKITGKLSYKVAVYGYYIGLILASIALLYFTRRIFEPFDILKATYIFLFFNDTLW